MRRLPLFSQSLLVSSRVISSRCFLPNSIQRASLSVNTVSPTLLPLSATLPSCRSFATTTTTTTKKKKKKSNNNPPKKLSKKARKRRDKERNEMLRARRERYQKLKRQNNLHPAAKMKRILSATDYWFSKTNLLQDHFMQQELRRYKGYIPLSTLLTFPKFHHWTNLQLLYDAYTSTASKGRYQVIVSKKRMEEAQQEEKLRQKREAMRERERQKRETQRRKRQRERQRQRDKILQQRVEQVFEKFQQTLLEEYKQELREERQQELLQEQSIRGYMERNKSWMGPAITVWDKVESLIQPREEDLVTLDSIDPEQVYDAMYDNEELYEYLEGHDLEEQEDEEEDEYWSDDEDYVLENTKNDNVDKIPKGGNELAVGSDSVFAGDKNADGAVGTMSKNTFHFDPLMHVDDDEEGKSRPDMEISKTGGVPTGTVGTDEDTKAKTAESDYKYKNGIGGTLSKNSFDFDPLLDGSEEEEEPLENKELQDDSAAFTETVNVKEDATDETTAINNDEAEEETVCDDDETFDLSYALLRHKRVSLDYLDQLWEEEATTETNDMLYGDHDDPYNYITGDFLWDETEEPEPPKKKQQQPPSVPNYTTNRPVVLIQKAAKLKSFCERLTESVKKAETKHGPHAAAIGFDVEYCTLELDIRGTLPAMLQLAGPTEESPIGLVWLDRFPNHGRDMLNDDECKPLMQLLANPTILKVGVSASHDVKHLLSWWGIDGSKHRHYFFGGTTDLEKEYAGREEVGNLAEMCKAVLERKLPKIKQKMTNNQKKRKRQGRRTPTAHWRAKNITKEMKEYAANDAACGIDVWMKLNSLPKESE